MSKNRNVGNEIKELSNFIRAIVCIPFIICGLLILFYGMYNEEGILCILGVIVVVVGFLIAWAVTLILYGYGELIEQTMQTNYAVRDLQNMVYKKLDETNASVSSEVKILTEINKNLSKRT